jgi:hypothetical protein
VRSFGGAVIPAVNCVVDAVGYATIARLNDGGAAKWMNDIAARTRFAASFGALKYGFDSSAGEKIRLCQDGMIFREKPNIDI